MTWSCARSSSAAGTWARRIRARATARLELERSSSRSSRAYGPPIRRINAWGWRERPLTRLRASAGERHAVTASATGRQCDRRRGESVVKDELDARDAGEAASIFLSIAGWLEDQATVAHSDVRGPGAQPPLGDFSDHDERDFRADLEEYRRDGSDFQVRLDRVVRNPSQAKYILPALLVGVATSLHIRRLHEHLRHLDDTILTDEDLSKYKSKAQFGANL